MEGQTGSNQVQYGKWEDGRSKKRAEDNVKEGEALRELFTKFPQNIC